MINYTFCAQGDNFVFKSFKILFGKGSVTFEKVSKVYKIVINPEILTVVRKSADNVLAAKSIFLYNIIFCIS